MTVSRFIHISTNDTDLFLWLNNIPLYLYLYTHCIFFIHSSVVGHLDCFHVLAIVKSTAMNIGVHMSFWIMLFSGHMHRSWIVWLYGSSNFHFLRNLHTVLHSGCYQLTFTPAVQENSFFSIPSPAFIVIFFNYGHSDGCEVILQCNFDLHFSNNWWSWASFDVFVGHLYVFFEEIRNSSVTFRKLKQGLCINLEGWDGERDVREVQKGGDICIFMTDSCWGLTENNKVL